MSSLACGEVRRAGGSRISRSTHRHGHQLERQIRDCDVDRVEDREQGEHEVVA